jgi:ABC-type lipoprotein export system ATPase subunit
MACVTQCLHSAVGVQQRVEIVKALYRKAHTLILDEPTAVLTPQEADDLFRIMRDLTSQGVCHSSPTNRGLGRRPDHRDARRARWWHLPAEADRGHYIWSRVS